MNKPVNPATHEPLQPDDARDAIPPGNHPSELAARMGFGPLSPLATDVWHGQSKPCVTCGQLVRRDATECEHCGQNLSPEMIEKMRAHAGPWYVLEHLRPFPGVNLDRIIRQIRRGLITETSIVRGPSTDYQWRYAVETPGLCRYFNRCWNCYNGVKPVDTYCQACLKYLSLDKPQPATNGAQPDTISTMNKPVPPDRDNVDDLYMLRHALNQVPILRHDPTDAPPQIAGLRVIWIATVIVIAVIAALIWLTQLRAEQTNPLTTSTPGIVAPVAGQ